MTLPAAHIVHVTPGRLRLRVPTMRGDKPFFFDLAQSIERAGTAGNVHASSVTGSILLEGLCVSVEDLRDVAHKQGWFDIRDDSSAEIESVSRKLERWQRKGTDELTRVAPWAALAFAAVQVGRGDVLPPALSLLTYAFDAARARDVPALKSKSIGS